MLGTVFNDANGAMAAQFVKEFNVGFPVGYATRDQVVSYLGLSVLDRWVVPQVAIIDRKGNIVAQSAATGSPELQERGLLAQLPRQASEGKRHRRSGAPAAKTAAKTVAKSQHLPRPIRRSQPRPSTRYLRQRGDRLGDFLAVEAAVLDEDLVGVHPGHQHSRQIHPLAIALQRLRIRIGRRDAGSKRMPCASRNFVSGR